jgi:hypothetical protein
MADGYYIAPNDLETYQNLVRNFTSNTVTEGLPQTNDELEFYYVKLDADLTATTDDSTPTTVDASVYYPQDDDTLADSTENIEITNRFNVEASSGDLLLVIYQHGEYIPLFASGGGGGGGGGCTVQCSSIELSEATIQHAQLPVGAQSTTNVWRLQDACGGNLPAITVESSDGNGTVTWPGGAPDLEHDNADDLFKLDISSECTAANNSGTDVTASSTITATIEMDWSVDPATITFDIDGTLP